MIYFFKSYKILLLYNKLDKNKINKNNNARSRQNPFP